MCLQAIVNKFAPPSKLGAVNGTAQSMASLVRALGPFLGGFMWAAVAAGTILIHQFLPAI